MRLLFYDKFNFKSNHDNVRYVVEPYIRKSERKEQYSTYCNLHIDTESCNFSEVKNCEYFMI